MKELVVISGKGGTGKTSLLAAFASMASRMALCDADVDAADLHLITAPEIKERRSFTSGHRAVIDPGRCSGCGICVDLCQWQAIGAEKSRWAKDISPNMVVENNRSPSFCYFRDKIRELAGTMRIN